MRYGHRSSNLKKAVLCRFISGLNRATWPHSRAGFFGVKRSYLAILEAEFIQTKWICSEAGSLGAPRLQDELIELDGYTKHKFYRQETIKW